MTHRRTRRHVLRALGTLGAGGLAGCSTGGTDQDASGTTTAGSGTTDSARTTSGRQTETIRSPTTRHTAALDGRSLLDDSDFSEGFDLRGTRAEQGTTVVDVLDWGQDGSPVWILSQWGSDYSLADADPRRLDGGAVAYENPGKRVVVGLGDEAFADLVLEVRGSAEWDEPRDSPHAQWPHLLVEQTLRPPDATASDPAVRTLDELDAFYLDLEARLRYVEMRMSESAYDPSLHTAHFLLTFVVRNVNEDSPDFGDFMWFNPSLYDYRYPDLGAPQSASRDTAGEGTDKFIYSPAHSKLTTETLASGDWVRVRADLLPLVEAGLDEAFLRGYFPESSLSDFAVWHTNPGWEVPGVFDCAMQLRNFELVEVDGDDSKHLLGRSRR